MELNATATDQATLDNLFNAFSSQERRQVIAYLHQRDGPVSISELPGSNLSLYHQHLPKLAEAGLIEYDPDTRTCRPTIACTGEKLIEVAQDY